ncbi:MULTISPECIES: helix-turn-helix domain-containing protein [Saliphagus]|uniref:Multiprotein-bridging factor 1 family protein n=1 Tax=Saliphagus infecundisoli TaxID=1849069 RepID=A0ABD5QH51_9EURY|nr:MULTISPECIES: multiprotein-bridging factor 1 family protein [Saliphagus]
MAKYSTGTSSGGGGDSCELCGAESGSLRTATVAGAELEVCPDCAPHGEGGSGRRSGSGGAGGGQSHGGSQDSEAERRKRAARNTAKANPIWDGDSEHWEREGTNYDDDQLPYLVSDYGEVVVEARRDAGYQRGELADELEVPESDLLAIEQGRATQAGVGGGLVRELEEVLEVELAE